MAECIFCKIVRGEIPTDFFYEDDNLVVFKDIHPKARIHLLVVPREHIPNLMKAKESDRDLLGNMLLIQNILAKAHGVETGFKTLINTGPGGGQEIDHLHFHFISD